MTILKVAIIGAGGMAHEHIRAFNALPNVDVCGIHSRTRNRAEELAASHSFSIITDSVDELAEQTQADLVVMTVPELSANSVAKACFKYDWAVLMEKPAGYCIEDAEDIANAAGGCESPVMVGFNRRFYSSTIAVKNDLDERPEEKRFIHVQDQQSYAEARHYNHPEQVVKNFMYANSIHNIDFLANFGRGEIVEVTPIMPWKGEETEVMVCHIAFDSGDTGIYEGIWKGPGLWTCSVSTPSRRWMMGPLEQASYQNANERAQNLIERSQVDKDYKAGFLLQAQAVIAKIRGETSPVVSLEESLKTMQLIHRMFGV